jgi:hypothetical protein
MAGGSLLFPCRPTRARLRSVLPQLPGARRLPKGGVGAEAAMAQQSRSCGDIVKEGGLSASSPKSNRSLTAVSSGTGWGLMAQFHGDQRLSPDQQPSGALFRAIVATRGGILLDASIAVVVLDLSGVCASVYHDPAFLQGAGLLDLITLEFEF